MNVSNNIVEIRAARRQNLTQSWGLVPTMGFLHKGHLSLVRRARQENDFVGVSIFVNPTQFNNPNDLKTYPGNIKRDLSLLEKEGVNLVWLPEISLVYPPGYQTWVNVEKITQPLEGAHRPGHFKGVATIVAKLFNVFQPQRAYFGQKDAQQVAVIKQMVSDLNFNLEIVVCPIQREADGLAMSSRNTNLSPKARQQALCLSQALTAAKTAFNQGQKEAAQLKAAMLSIINKTPMAQADYVSVAHPRTLQELTLVNDGALLSMAVFVDGIRLIDNMIIEKVQAE